jgi:hypothetical protein
MATDLKDIKDLNFGTGDLCETNADGSPKFTLSSKEWYEIQCYVNDASQLPTTEAALKNFFGSDAPSDLSDFKQLTDAYKNVNDHTSYWQENTFSHSVSLASDIYNYSSKAKNYFAPIYPLAQKLIDNPNDEAAKDKLVAILDMLSKDADKYKTTAGNVSKEIANFAEQTANDGLVLGGNDGKEGLYKYYNDKYGNESLAVSTLQTQLDSETKVLKTETANYSYDVTVAATTPTYVWIVPCGTIAAAVVAGVYGKRATDALRNIHAAQALIDTMNSKIKNDTQLMFALYHAVLGIDTILRSLESALSVIQKIEGAWGAISDDLKAISDTIKEDISKALPMIMDIGVDTAIKEWETVGNLANTYRLNAYITVK